MLPDGTTIELHSKDDCPYCSSAKAWLAERGIAYSEVLHNDRTERNSFYDSLGLVGGERSVPQVFLVDLAAGGERFRIGGYADLEASGLG